MKKKLYIRADGDEVVGHGHLIRSLALAKILEEKYDSCLLTQSLDTKLIKVVEKVCSSIIFLREFDVIKQAELICDKYLNRDDYIIIDSYELRAEYQKKIKQTGCKLIVIDDLVKWHHYADLVINHAPGITSFQYDAEDYTNFCLGAEYALLRPEFITANKRISVNPQNANIFICFGGSDNSNLTCKVLQGLSTLQNVTFTVVVGSSYVHMKELKSVSKSLNEERINILSDLCAKSLIYAIENAQLAVVPSSGISLEVLALNRPFITGFTAKNQISIMKGLQKYESVMGIGDFNRLTFEEINFKVRKFLESHNFANNTQPFILKTKELLKIIDEL